MKRADSIVLAGQSNAVGYSKVNCLPKHFPAERIQKWRDGYENVKINYFSHYKRSNGFVPTTLGCTMLEDETLGPEVGMAEALNEKYPGRDFFIVKFAFGGVNLNHDFLSPSGEENGAPHTGGEVFSHDYSKGAPAQAGWCWNELVKILSESIASLESEGYAPAVRAFCWVQGESDAVYEEPTAKYLCHYDAFLHDLKARFAGYMDGCKFIDAGISIFWERYMRINEIKRSYAAGHADCAYIDTIDAGIVTTKEPYDAPDLGHYDSDCMIRFGHLFADAIGDI